tara:strand:+ start:167291 stop:168325 length:1035 start_codon:yes stop_codon:yes gene_type:complete
MKKIYFLIVIAVLSLFITTSCKKDDGFDPDFIPARERSEEVVASTMEVEAFLETHFYNYEEFDNPPANFDYRIKFDTIAGDNANKIKLIDQVDFKMVQDRVDTDVTYKLYYLNVIQGEGESPNFPDIATISYEGWQFNNEPDNENIIDEYELFDSSVVPVQFDLTQIVNGLQDVLIEFNGATGFTENPDGTIAFENFGVGAVFMQSGLGYYVSPPAASSIGVYSQLVFSFHLYETEVGDQDQDTIPSTFEDVNGNGLEEDDDTDGDTIPNYLDTDDDGDFRLSVNEVEENEYVLNPGDPTPTYAPNEFVTNTEVDDTTGITTITTITFTDTDGDGTPDYLDPDN